MAQAAEVVQSTKELSGPGLRTFFRIVEAWKADEQQRISLLGVPRATYYRWKRDPSQARLSHDTLERLSYLFGIYKALHILLPDPVAADAWVKRPNNNVLFNGRAPLDRMVAGNVADLFVVRQYLDAERGWN